MQVSEQGFYFNGCRKVQSFAYTPPAIELVYYQLGISTDDCSGRWKRTQILQDAENTGVLSQVIGHGTVLTNKAALPDQNSTILVFY